VKNTMTTKNTSTGKSLFLIAPLLLALSACSDSTDFDFEASAASLDAANDAVRPPEALFNPLTGVIPFPNNILFIDQTTGAPAADGTLNIPIAPDADQSLSNPQVALNQLDGFSTVAPIVTTLSEPVDPDTLIVGETVRIFEAITVNAQGLSPNQIAIAPTLGAELTGSQIAAAAVGDQIVLLPITPLKPSQAYFAILTNGITDMATDDVPAMGLQPAALYASLKDLASPLTVPPLNGLQQATGSHLQALGSLPTPVSPDTVALSWVFTTQSIRETMEATKVVSNTSPLTLNDTTVDQGAEGAADQVSIYAGSLDVPYYLTAVGADGNPLAALGSFWSTSDQTVPGAINADGVRNYTPAPTSTETIPVLMAVPNAADTSVPLPVTIFQHGITGNRTAMLAIANAIAAQGRVVISIDLPMHGLTSMDEPGGAFMVSGNGQGEPRERHFNIDIAPNDDSDEEAEGSDGLIDPSGTYFINLANLANARDNLRQSVADLFVLRASLAGATIGSGDSAIMLDGTDVSYVGHSLGGIVGTTMLSYFDNAETGFHSATLAMPGGGIAELLNNSPQFSPRINSQLAENNIEPGTAAFAQFFAAAQSMIDSADPINHAGTLANAGNSPAIHMIEVVGDTVVPNAAATAPLAGTEPLARQLQLVQLDATDESASPKKALVCFSQGDHGSLLLPASDDSVADIAEMQAQTAGFAASMGLNLTIADSSVIQPVVMDPTGTFQLPCSVVAAAAAGAN